jgi:hypothetical protein
MFNPSCYLTEETMRWMSEEIQRVENNAFTHNWIPEPEPYSDRFRALSFCINWKCSRCGALCFANFPGPQQYHVSCNENIMKTALK